MSKSISQSVLTASISKFVYCEQRHAFVLRSTLMRIRIAKALSVFMILFSFLGLRLVALTGDHESTTEQRYETLMHLAALPHAQQAEAILSPTPSDAELRSTWKSQIESDKQRHAELIAARWSDTGAGAEPPLVERPPQISREERAANFLQTRFKMKEDMAVRIAKSVYLNADELMLNPNTLFGLIEAESTFKPNEMSPTGAIGLMQILPRWHLATVLKAKDLFGLESNLYTPEVNIWVGARIKRQYLDKYNGKLDLALLQYNGSLHDPDKAYYHKVMRYAQLYERELK